MIEVVEEEVSFRETKTLYQVSQQTINKQRIERIERKAKIRERGRYCVD